MELLDNNLPSEIEKISNQFLCCYPILKINFGTEFTKLSWDEQLIFLNKSILNKKLLKYPLSKTYQIAFLKKIIELLEKENVEIHDKIYESYCTLVHTNECNDWSYKHYKINDYILTIKESNKFISEGTTGLCSWQASIALSEWILKNNKLFVDKEILELGSGAGLLGFIVAKFCNIKKVFLSDCHESVLELLRENVCLNFSNVNNKNLNEDIICVTKYHNKTIGILNLPWESLNLSNLFENITPDIIIAADVIYDETLFTSLITVVTTIFNRKYNLCKFILAATIRNVNTYTTFVQLLEDNKFVIAEEEYVPPGLLFWDETTEIKIISITR